MLPGFGKLWRASMDCILRLGSTLPYFYLAGESGFAVSLCTMTWRGTYEDPGVVLVLFYCLSLLFSLVMIAFRDASLASLIAALRSGIVRRGF